MAYASPLSRMTSVLAAVGNEPPSPQSATMLSSGACARAAWRSDLSGASPPTTETARRQTLYATPETVTVVCTLSVRRSSKRVASSMSIVEIERIAASGKDERSRQTSMMNGVYASALATSAPHI
eukprot:6664547-Prymnesium_polylepis.3